MSTYSRLTVTKHESSILDLMPGYLDSSSANSLPRDRGAGSASRSLLVNELAPAKYKILKWPAGGLEVDAIAAKMCGLRTSFAQVSDVARPRK